MVILLSGNSCTGKTLISQKLLEKYKISYFSIDYLKMGLYRGDKNCGFTPLDSNQMIGEKLWPILKGMIETYIENKQSIIIEGCYLLPHYVKELKKDYPDEILSIFLVFSNEYIKENFETKILKHRHVAETRKYPEERPITQFIIEHEELRKKCKENGLDYFEIHNNYQKEIEKVYDFIENEINEI